VLNPSTAAVALTTGMEMLSAMTVDGRFESIELRVKRHPLSDIALRPTPAHSTPPRAGVVRPTSLMGLRWQLPFKAGQRFSE